MRSLLIFPPQGHFTQPYLSLPSLTAYLQANGYPDVHQMDVSIEAYDHFLSEPRLRRALARVRAPERLAELDAKDALRFSEMERYQSLSELALVGDEVAARIEEAKAVLRDPEAFYDYERYLWAGRTVEQALRVFSAEYAPSRLTPHGFVMRYRVESSAEILRALEDEAENPFPEFFREHTMPRIRELDPDLVGISMTFGSQVIPALALARQIKAWKPDVHITIGGGLMAYVGEKMARRPELWSLIDTIVLLEGERPLLELCEVVDGKRELDSVSNIIHHASGGKVTKTEQLDPLDIKSLPTPVFEGLPLEKYLTPELVLPLAATRGCYWGKCVFCTLYTVIGPGYRGRTIEQTVDDMRILQERHGVSSFYLAIEDLPPNMAKRFPEAILEAGLDVSWWCDARLEHDVFTQDTVDKMARAGCKRIAFGYESASERVLEKMCKGIDPERSLELIRRVHEAGISVTLYTMLGFPTETRAEAESTLRTIMANQRYIQEVSARVFYLDESSEVFRRREEFDIVEVYPDEDADLQIYYDFKTGSGMSRAEARQVYLDFTRALRSSFPVFTNDNMLYHELKSHYFLYLKRYGTFEELDRSVLSRRAGAAAEERPPSRQRDLVLRALRYDRTQLDETVSGIDSATLRPRYQSDLLEEEDRRRFDAELEPMRPDPSTLVYNPRTGEIRCLSPHAVTLLERCDGSRSLEEVVEVFPPEARDDAKRAVDAIGDAGLLEPTALSTP